MTAILVSVPIEGFISLAEMVASLKALEGFRANPYQDPLGHWTIGYGHACSQGHAPVSERTAMTLLRGDIITAVSDAVTNWSHYTAGAQWPDPRTSSGRTGALVEQAYQLGRLGQSLFTRMWAAIRAGDWGQAAMEMRQSQWCRQTPVRAHRCAEMMETDIYRAVSIITAR